MNTETTSLKLSETFRIPGEGKHAYDIEAIADSDTGRKTITLRVHANARSTAAKRASKAGFKVMSVNMIG